MNGSLDAACAAFREAEDATRGYDFEHRLRDFNNLPETQLTDIRRVLSVAKEGVAGRLRARP